MDWSPDGSTVATAGGDAVKLWSPDSGEELYTLEDADVLHMRFSRDGRLLATGGAQVRVWDVATGDEVANLAGHSGWAFAVGFNPDGSQLVSGGQDGLVKIWDIEGGVEIQTLADHGSEVWGVAWSTDGSIATVGRWGDVRIHSRDLDALERAARDRVTRSLTDAECRQYLHLDACQ